MNSPSQPDARPNREELSAQLSQELIRLRDALVSLSISLKDWRFEQDETGKLATQKIATEALNKFKLQRSSNADSSETSRSSVAKD
jgi:hypothetical protein